MTKRRKKAFKDPHQAREAEKYDKPIASREAIMQLLREVNKPLNYDEIAAAIGVEDDCDREALRRRLRAMERDGQLLYLRNKRYGLPEKMDLVTATVVAHPDGHGFAKETGGDASYFLSPHEMRKVFHGDSVLVCPVGGERRGIEQARIVEVLASNTEKVVGCFQRVNGINYVIPENRRVTHDILIAPEFVNQAKEGQIVTAAIIGQPSRHAAPQGKIIEILGDPMAPGMEIDIALRCHDLPHQWPTEVAKEADTIPSRVLPADKKAREDLCELPFITIDGEDAKDFDDAVYCEPLPGNGWHLYVAIADVSHYVKPHTALDKEAENRATSVYFPGSVIPMLPFSLSNGICSLKPRVERLSVVCRMSISSQGKVRSYQFFNAVIRSQARMTYNKVAKLLADPSPALQKQYQWLMPHLEALECVFHLLLKQRQARGAIDFDMPETQILFTPDRKIQKIVPRERTEAHRLIEECMLAANVCAAEFLKKHNMPFLYRSHAGPQAKKLKELREFLNELGLGLRGGDKPSPKDYALLLQQAQVRPDFQLIQTVLLRSLSQAVYEPKQIGHFGLAYEAYTHFTSPIRRYPDLLVHRAIKHLLEKKKAETFTYSAHAMQALGEHCSMAERRADEASWDVIEWLKCEYMSNKIGEIFQGTISTVTGFGLFVSLNEVFVEGLIHISNLQNDYYHFDAVRHALCGERSGSTYRLGDEVTIQVSHVSINERKIDFELLASQSTSKRKRKRKKK